MSDAAAARWRGEARAVEIAATLTRLHGDRALGRATRRHRDAADAGNIVRADLYRAVCTVIEDRNGVISRWRTGKWG